MHKLKTATTKLMIGFSLFLLVLILCSSVKAQSIKLLSSPTSIFVDDIIWESSKLSFISHIGPGPYDSYVTMDIPHLPVLKTCKAIESAIGRKLTNRGEAHITVITPPEFTGILKSALTMAEINDIAKEHRIQESSFDILCIGSGNRDLETVNEETFFFVVQSPDLLKIRKKIAEAFEAAGGIKGAFKPESFFPHITIGFTKRDLHLSDQVIKDDTSYDKRFKILIGI